jgi:hypothetical protein
MLIINGFVRRRCVEEKNCDNVKLVAADKRAALVYSYGYGKMNSRSLENRITIVTTEILLLEPRLSTATLFDSPSLFTIPTNAGGRTWIQRLYSSEQIRITHWRRMHARIRVFVRMWIISLANKDTIYACEPLAPQGHTIRKTLFVAFDEKKLSNWFYHHFHIRFLTSCPLYHYTLPCKLVASSSTGHPAHLAAAPVDWWKDTTHGHFDA